MSDDLDSLRPHPNTGDEAPVSYRAKHIRRLFAEIDFLRQVNDRLHGLIDGSTGWEGTSKARAEALSELAKLDGDYL